MFQRVPWSCAIDKIKNKRLDLRGCAKVNEEEYQRTPCDMIPQPMTKVWHHHRSNKITKLWLDKIKRSDHNSHMIAIDTISGIFDHSERCMAQIEMDWNPPVALHPELREYALFLLRESTPLYLLRFKCATWAEQKWSNQVGDSQYRFQLSSHDSSFLYRTIASERGILQRTLAEDNLDRWFWNSKPVPPSLHHVSIIKLMHHLWQIDSKL